MLRATTAVLIAASFLISCSKSESKKFSVSPQINIKAIDGRCLDLQSAIQQMDNPEFNFPGFVYTRNFEIVTSKVRSEYADSLMAKSFRAHNANFRGLPDLRGAQQQSCEKVILTEFGGKSVTYNIVSYSKNYLELDLDKTALEESLSEMSVHHKKQLAKTPMVKKFIITLPAPTEMEVVSVYNAIPSECYNSTSLTLREEAVYGWADSTTRVAQNARINPEYWRKLEHLAGLPKVEERPEEGEGNEGEEEIGPIDEAIPGPVEEPLPPPAARVRAAQVVKPTETVATAETVVNLLATPPTVAALKTYAHPHCF